MLCVKFSFLKIEGKSHTFYYLLIVCFDLIQTIVAPLVIDIATHRSKQNPNNRSLAFRHIKHNQYSKARHRRIAVATE